jgi:hypothetical protein
MAKGTWILERTNNDRFPYRLQVLRDNRPWLVLRTQDKWPAAGRHIFCLREDEPPTPDEELEELERVDVIAFNERGRRVSVILDRSRYKHPALRIVFCANRKVANEWTRHFFAAVWNLAPKEKVGD